jgi:thiol:disulfide interchange protein DsbD
MIRATIFLAAVTLAGVAAAAGRPAPADAAFQLVAARAPDGVRLSWITLPGYYLYRDRFEAATPDGRPVALETPSGETKEDPNFGSVEVYHGGVDILAPVAGLPARGALHVVYQGCAESGFCYAPIAKTIDLRTLAVADDPSPPAPR